MAHHSLGHTSQHPALHAGTAVGAHGDQTVGSMARHAMISSADESFLGYERDFLESSGFHLLGFNSKIRHDFGTEFGQEGINLTGIIKTIAGIARGQRTAVDTEQRHFQIKCFANAST